MLTRTGRGTQTSKSHPTNSSEQGLAGARPNRPAHPAPGAHGAGHAFDLIPILPAPTWGQSRLAVSEPGDVHEREAERVAENVMRMSRPGPQCACGGECSECAGKPSAEVLPARAAPGGGAAASHDVGAVGGPAGRAAASPLEPLPGDGRPLPASERAFFEPRFGWDFGRVRIHDGERPARSAESLGARAYTLGDDIVFNRGEYQPGTERGRRLLAHELAHVVQQRTVVGRQLIQRALLPKDMDCDEMTGLPIHEKTTLPRSGVYYTRTFQRPPSGKVKVTATAASGSSACVRGSKYSVRLFQCHLIGEEPIEDGKFKEINDPVAIDYTLELPTEEWNTYEKFALRVNVTCDDTDVDIKIDPA